MVPPRGTRLRVSHVPVLVGWTSSQMKHHLAGAPPPPRAAGAPQSGGCTVGLVKATSKWVVGMDGWRKTSRIAKILVLFPSPSIVCGVGMTQIRALTFGDDF